MFVGCLMLVGGLLQLQGAVRWRVTALGFLLGVVCGMLAGRPWILRHPHGETAVRALGLSGWLRRWWWAVLLVVLTPILATVPTFSHIFELISGPASLQGALTAGLGGLFLGFGFFLSIMQRH